MTVQELIDELNKIDDKTLEVSVWADHGQYNMKASSVEVQRLEDDSDYMRESVSEEDYDMDDPEDKEYFEGLSQTVEIVAG